MRRCVVGCGLMMVGAALIGLTFGKHGLRLGDWVR